MLIHTLIRRHLRLHRPDDGGEGSGGGAAAAPRFNTQLPPDTPADAGGAPADGAAPEGEGATPAAEPQGQAETPPGDAGADGEGEPTLLLDDAPLHTEETKPWVKELRKKFRDQAQRLAQYERGGATPAAGPAALPPAPGPKPELRNFDFDAEQYAAALDKWHDANNKRAAAEKDAQARQTQDQRDWEARVTAYQQAGRELGFADFEDCEAAALTELSPTQQGIIVQGAEKPALVMYALGRNPQLARDLAKLEDPVKFAFAVADLQRKLTVAKRKPTTKPEPAAPASSRSASEALAGEDRKRETLRQEAVRTGDMSKLLAYNREQRSRRTA